MLNIFLILYWLVIAIFVGGCLAVIYHIWIYRFSNKTSLMVILLFLIGAVVLGVINLIVASRIPWSEFSIIL